MKDFRKKSGFGGYNKGEKKFGGPKPWERRGGDDRPTMHRATCADCGNACEVPFKPNGRKPISCNDCFRKDDRGGASSYGEKRAYKTDRPSERRMEHPSHSAGSCNHDAQIKMINAKLDMILEVLGADTADV